MKRGTVERSKVADGQVYIYSVTDIEEDLLRGRDIELELTGHRIILRADESGVITGYILEG